jgi:manganese efflux pump family protein
LGRLAAFVVPLCLDTFAVAAALGAAGLTPRQRLQVSVLFPLAETTMPVAGMLAGRGVASAVGGAADYVAAAVLVALGVYLLVETESTGDRRSSSLAGIGTWTLLALAFSLSLDELALGFGIGLLRLSLLAAVIMIGVQAVIASQLGLLLGARVSERSREGAERLAGAALLGIGTFFAVEAAVG